MEIRQIRNATNKIQYGGKTFLLDPWLEKKFNFGSFMDIPGVPYVVPEPVKMQLPVPFYDLPCSVEEVLDGVDYYIVTHIHMDHIDVAPDGTVGAPLHKDVPVFVQNEEDAEVFKKSGFQDVRVLPLEGVDVDGVKLSKAPARHGTIIPAGDSMGVVFQAENEKTLYVSGDTVSGIRKCRRRCRNISRKS